MYTHHVHTPRIRKQGFKASLQHILNRKTSLAPSSTSHRHCNYLARQHNAFNLSLPLLIWTHAEDFLVSWQGLSTFQFMHTDRFYLIHGLDNREFRSMQLWQCFTSFDVGPAIGHFKIILDFFLTIRADELHFMHTQSSIELFWCCLMVRTKFCGVYHGKNCIIYCLSTIKRNAHVKFWWLTNTINLLPVHINQAGIHDPKPCIFCDDLW